MNPYSEDADCACANSGVEQSILASKNVELVSTVLMQSINKAISPLQGRVIGPVSRPPDPRKKELICINEASMNIRLAVMTVIRTDNVQESRKNGILQIS